MTGYGTRKRVSFSLTILSRTIVSYGLRDGHFEVDSPAYMHLTSELANQSVFLTEVVDYCGHMTLHDASRIVVHGVTVDASRV